MAEDFPCGLLIVRGGNMKRVYNFNAGPSAMPLEVLKEVQDEFLDFNHTGMSIVEISHRSARGQFPQETRRLFEYRGMVQQGHGSGFLLRGNL